MHTHYMLNIVIGNRKNPQAALIGAVRPIKGAAVIILNRKNKSKS